MATAFSGRRVAVAVAILLALTVVIPPAAALGLARWRIARTRAAADSTATWIASRRASLRELASAAPVVRGPGRIPDNSEEGRSWVAGPLAITPELASGWSMDAWGRCLLLNVRAIDDARGALLISAGPNGRIDTPIDATNPRGDDIAATVR